MSSIQIKIHSCLFALAIVVSTPATATEVYHWVDENGVTNYSQDKPAQEINGVSKLTLEDSPPSDYDPEEDRYGVQAQAETMAAFREEMAQRRDDARERRKDSQQQVPAPYREPERSYSRGLWLPPYYARPPVRPEPPIAVPYETASLEPPGNK